LTVRELRILRRFPKDRPFVNAPDAFETAIEPLPFLQFRKSAATMGAGQQLRGL
jgi:hypothetical protein